MGGKPVLQKQSMSVLKVGNETRRSRPVSGRNMKILWAIKERSLEEGGFQISDEKWQTFHGPQNSKASFLCVQMRQNPSKFCPGQWRPNLL